MSALAERPQTYTSEIPNRQTNEMQKLPRSAIIWREGERTVISVGTKESPFTPFDNFFAEIRQQIDTTAAVKAVLQSRSKGK